MQSHRGTAELEPYRGKHIAVYNGELVGSSDNPLQLELDLARKYGVHPQRFVIVYIDPPPAELEYRTGAPPDA